MERDASAQGRGVARRAAAHLAFAAILSALLRWRAERILPGRWLGLRGCRGILCSRVVAVLHEVGNFLGLALDDFAQVRHQPVVLRGLGLHLQRCL